MSRCTRCNGVENPTFPDAERCLHAHPSSDVSEIARDIDDVHLMARSAMWVCDEHECSGAGLLDEIADDVREIQKRAHGMVGDEAFVVRMRLADILEAATSERAPCDDQADQCSALAAMDKVAELSRPGTPARLS